MGKRITTWLDRFFDGIHWKLVDLGWREPETQSSADFFIFLTLVFLALSVHPLICYRTISHDPHVVFWMGTEMQQANLLVPAVLVGLMLIVFLIQRAQAQPTVVRGLVFLSFIVAGSVVAGIGVHIFHASQHTSADLVHRCGASGTMTQLVEAEWYRLDQFRQGCAAELGYVSLVNHCPGFADVVAAAPRAIFAGYMQELEMDYGCSGFCQPRSGPLFNSHAETSNRCSSALGERMMRAGAYVGLPMLATGVVLEVLGALIMGYDNL